MCDNGTLDSGIVHGSAVLRGYRRGITLIELLTSVSIIAAVIGIILPSCQRAARQVRADVCLSNCGQIGIAVVAYQQDSLSLPWYVRWGEAGTFRSGASGYGGFAVAGGEWDGLIPSNERPLNRYIGGQALTESSRVFACPDDLSGYWWRVGARSSEPVNSGAWRRWGNSYPLNWHWLERVLSADTRWQEYYDAIDQYGGAIGSRSKGCDASRFIIAMEDCADVSFAGATTSIATSESQPVVGWHGRVGVYSLLFLDGHAAQDPVDARLAVGPGWSVR